MEARAVATPTILDTLDTLATATPTTLATLATLVILQAAANSTEKTGCKPNAEGQCDPLEMIKSLQVIRIIQIR